MFITEIFFQSSYFGGLTYKCFFFCNVAMWYDERIDPSKSTFSSKFNMCYKKYLICLQIPIQPFLRVLFDANGGVRNSNFRKFISIYNSFFQFTSLGH